MESHPPEGVGDSDGGWLDVEAIRAKGKGKGKGFECYNCEGMGHISANCPSPPNGGMIGGGGGGKGLGKTGAPNP